MKNKPVLTLGFSPCPNDTFIFDALVNKRLGDPGFEVEPVIADVEELNRLSESRKLDITKLSFHAFLYVSDKYSILDSGAALGKNNGPLLISRKKIYPDEVPSVKIAIPGNKTTAGLLLSMAYPGNLNTKEYLFSDIEEAVLEGEADAGLIIHETRFTYKQRGLQKIMDFGEYWEEKHNLPLPLGGIMIANDLPKEIKSNFSKALKQSVEFAFNNPQTSAAYVRSHAQEMDEEVLAKHIGLYVNNYSLSLGEEGRKAVRVLLGEGGKVKSINNSREGIFWG